MDEEATDEKTNLVVERCCQLCCKDKKEIVEGLEEGWK